MAERRGPGGVLVGLVLLVTAGAAGMTAGALPAGGASVVGGNLPVNGSATVAADLSAHNSPAAARSPVDSRLLAVVNRVDTPSYSCALRLSGDGGRTWQEAAIPFPEGEEQPPRCFAPDLAFGADGALHVSFVTLAGRGNTPNAAWTTSLAPGARALSTPVRVTGPLAFQVRLAADPTRPGRLALSWLQGHEVGLFRFSAPGNPVVVSRSDDGGATWSSPVRVSAPERRRAVAPSIAAGPDGQLHVLYLDLGDDSLDYEGAHGGQGGEPYPGRWSLVLARSADAGVTWTEATVDGGVVPGERMIVFTPPFPSLAVDGARVYVAFADARLGDRDVWVWASTDGGRTFARPVRVNDTARGDGTAQYLPRLAVAPGGRLDVVYYDRRADAGDVHNEVSLQSSHDGARSFTPRLRLSDRPFDARVGTGSERNLADLGSRLGLVSTRDHALAVWTDTRTGTEGSGKQDLARAVVAFAQPSPLRAPLRLAGAVAALAGVAFGFTGVRRGRRRGDGGSGRRATGDERQD